MKVLVGLGNPGRQYEKTRHNIGFMVVEELVRELKSSGQSVSWKEKSNCVVAEVRLLGEVTEEKVLVVKPMTFMNLSGEAVRKVLEFYKLEKDSLSEHLIVCHDEIDLPFGKIRLKHAGGDGGHNGIRSISAALNSTEYLRVRLGVGRPGEETAASTQQSSVGTEEEKNAPDISRWVLGNFKEAEMSELREFLSRGVLAIRELVQSGLKIAQNKFN